jgi:small conductance mechanosensitive channel
MVDADNCRHDVLPLVTLKNHFTTLHIKALRPGIGRMAAMPFICADRGPILAIGAMMGSQSTQCMTGGKPMEAALNVILDRLYAAFSLHRLGDQVAAGLINLLVAAIVFIAFLLSWMLARWLLSLAFRRANGDTTTAAFMQTALKFTLLSIGAISALDSAGIKMDTVLASLGIVGLTIGFAAKDALSNLISGILIFLDRPFVIGDLVEIEGRYGRVERITLRSTRIITSDGKMLAVPNTDIINRTVASYTNFPSLRLDIGINIAVTESIDQARSALLALVQDKPEYMRNPAPRVVVTALNDYNIGLELQAWIHDEHDHIAIRFQLREQMFKALIQAGIEMPFETLQVVQVRRQEQEKEQEQEQAGDARTGEENGKF